MPLSSVRIAWIVVQALSDYWARVGAVMGITQWYCPGLHKPDWSSFNMSLTPLIGQEILNLNIISMFKGNHEIGFIALCVIQECSSTWLCRGFNNILVGIWENLKTEIKRLFSVIVNSWRSLTLENTNLVFISLARYSQHLLYSHHWLKPCKYEGGRVDCLILLISAKITSDNTSRAVFADIYSLIFCSKTALRFIHLIHFNNYFQPEEYSQDQPY